MNNGIAAAIPFVIALAGANVPSIDDVSREVRIRSAVTASSVDTEAERLTEEQQKWFDEHNRFGMPRTKYPGNRTVIVRQGYTLVHNNVDLIADWVTFHLTKAHVEGEEKRPGTSAFKPDPTLPRSKRAELSDYKGWKGVYDRGHQVASADSKGRGKRVIRESFFLSNMTPQDSKLNQHKWRLLEEKIQKLAAQRGELWVTTGPVFVDDDNDGLVEYFVIGENQVAVPTHYFKIVVSNVPNDSGKFEAMAFLIPNEPMKDEFEDYLVSIDEIERLTGFDFLWRIEDSVEETLESMVADKVWKVDA